MTVVEMSQTKKGSPMDKIDDPELRERISAAQNWLRDQYSALGSWKKVTRKIGGYEESSVNAFVNGSYPGSPAKLLMAIERARELEAERQSTVFTPAFCETSIARKIRKSVRQTRARGQLGIVAGKSGMGKTATFREVAAADSRIIYVRGNATFSRNVWTVVTVLCSHVGIGSGKGASPAILYAQLQQALLARRAMLVIDEAQFLCRGALDALRTLSEDSETPILFSGNETLHEFGFLSGINPAAFIQFTSRCFVQEHLQPSDITADDVRMIAGQILSDSVLDDTVDVLLGHARGAGAFRRLQAVLQRAYEKAKGSSITTAQVIDAANKVAKLRGAL